MNTKNTRRKILFIFLFSTAVISGTLLGLASSGTINIKNEEYINEEEIALPTKLLDINGKLITELVAEENREITNFIDIPRVFTDALLTREDRVFYKHSGFSFKALFRAVLGVISRRSLGGGSTLTQQIAGTIHCDRNEKSVSRKLRELWWALQMERRYSKNEILEQYLNRIYFGGGTYGVNAACKYYFSKEVKDITAAEAALLVIQLSNPAYYNPFEHPNRAMNRQKAVLTDMAKARLISKEEAEESYEEFWTEFDYTRTSASAYMDKSDKAPWFSEYVRRELNNMIYGTQNIYTAGFTVHTTLDLDAQQKADEVMATYIKKANSVYRRTSRGVGNSSSRSYTPVSELLSLVFDLPEIKVSKKRSAVKSEDNFLENITPVLDILSLTSGNEALKMGFVNEANARRLRETEKTTVEGTMVCIENGTGFIKALVGGSRYDKSNQFIRAVQSRLQPGSTFKPLYYTAAIDSKKFTAATVLSDTPTVFHNPDGKPYIPQNYRGEWAGDVILWYALVKSTNVPSLKVLEGVGFKDAINMSSILLGIPVSELESRNFVESYTLGLGVCSVTPLELARAYCVLASGGRSITPVAIRSVEDRNGNVILNPEREAHEKDLKAGNLISRETAYVMTKTLEKTVEVGTLAAQRRKFLYTDKDGNSYYLRAGGKTGTTQNWEDAWAVGFTPYCTSSFWFGFDRPGQSLGINLTGATLSGFAWGDFMGYIHKGEKNIDFFERPSSGVTAANICNDSGLLAGEACSNTSLQWFLSGTAPREVCNSHEMQEVEVLGISRLKKGHITSGVMGDFEEDDELEVDLDFLNKKGKKKKNGSSGFNGEFHENSTDDAKDEFHSDNQDNGEKRGEVNSPFRSGVKPDGSENKNARPLGNTKREAANKARRLPYRKNSSRDKQNSPFEDEMSRNNADEKKTSFSIPFYKKRDLSSKEGMNKPNASGGKPFNQDKDRDKGASGSIQRGEVNAEEQNKSASNDEFSRGKSFTDKKPFNEERGDDLRMRKLPGSASEAFSSKKEAESEKSHFSFEDETGGEKSEGESFSASETPESGEEEADNFGKPNILKPILKNILEDDEGQ